MDRTLGIVQPRATAAAFPNRFKRKLAGKSWLEWAIRRAADSQQIERLVVVVPEDASGRSIAELVPPDVDVLLTEGDPLRCLAEAIDSYGAYGVVRITADNPFVDPALIDRLVTSAEQHPACDYVSYRAQNGQPVVKSPLGIFAEWCRGEALQIANERATSPEDRNEPTRYIYSHPELFSVRLLAVPERLDREDVRLRLDVEEDWLHAEEIFEALGPDSLEWQKIASLLEVQPGLRERMAHLNRTLPGG